MNLKLPLEWIISLVPGCVDTFLKLGEIKGSSFKMTDLGISIVSEKRFVLVWLVSFSEWQGRDT